MKFGIRVVRAVMLLSILLLFVERAQAADGVRRGVTVAASITQNDIRDLAVWGVNVVRFPLSCGNDCGFTTQDQYLAWLDRAMAHLDTLLPTFQASEIQVIILLYSPPGNFTRTKGGYQHSVFSSAASANTLVAAWQNIAAHYATNPTIWAYDTLNEPAERKVVKGLRAWKVLSRDIAYSIRAVDATHRIIVEAAWGSPTNIRQIPPIPLPGIVYSAHMYFTLKFQQQGLYGNPLGVSYPSKGLTQKKLESVLKPLAQYQARTGAEIYIGEFSAVRWAPGRSSINYLTDVIAIFERYGWHWTYHAFREANAWSLEHGPVYMDPTPSPTVTERAALVRSYLMKNW